MYQQKVLYGRKTEIFFFVVPSFTLRSRSSLIGYLSVYSRGEMVGLNALNEVLGVSCIFS